jgi:multiple sugar transport system permease protein
MSSAPTVKAAKAVGDGAAGRVLKAIKRKLKIRSRGELVLRMVQIVFTIVALVFIAFPIYWLVTLSIKPLNEQLVSPPVWIPKALTFEFYKTAWLDRSVFRYFINGMVVSISSTLLSLVIGTSAAYGLSKGFRGANTIALLILVVRMIPPIVLVIPLFMIMRSFHLLDTYQGLILVYIAFTLPYTTWLMRSFFIEIPAELEEAARVDGCSRLGALVRVILPVVAPGLAASGVFAFLMAWNEFMFALVLTRSLKTQTMPVVASLFMTDQYVLWGLLAATGVIAVLPIIVLMLFAQKHFVKGLTFGAVKG